MSLCSSYSPNYFSLIDILATQERVSCQTRIILPGLGFLDVSSESPDLQPGTKLDLPHWLAFPLNAPERRIVNITVPKIYKESYKEIINADASAIDLNKWCTYYYEFGIHLSGYNHRDCEKIQDLLLQTFKSRFRLVMDWAQNTGTDPTVGSQLPVLEKSIFTAGRKSRCILISWLKEGGGNIETSDMVVNHKKRKRTEFETNNT
ncbi:DNA replication complex GINS protein PSF3 [Athalia rosae]|uniref:DNA replication complex GINS protein PSF3 n=1 Tax=Athalia rosae TaxID=37344 RepID=UPI0006262D9F|nr:DNA replication complex GINS protein PSF3 [Athalia rosae]